MTAVVEHGYMNLNTLWFALIAVLWIGFFFLEGFDFGVGILSPFLAKDDTDRRVMINTVGPLWDGNEVWLIVAGGATFAAFPEWYATLFSGMYPAFFLVVAGLIFRGVAFEFRGKGKSQRWKAGWDKALFWGSLIPTFLLGVAFSDMVRGLPIDAHKEFQGGFFDLLHPYALVGGLTFVGLFTLHGGVFLSLKTDGEIRDRARASAQRLAPIASTILFAFLAWTYYNAEQMDNKGIVPGVIPIGAIVACASVGWLLREKLEGWSFVATGLSIVLTVATVFLNLYPRVMVSSIDAANDLTIWNSSSTAKTLGVMTIVALIFTPIVLGYQGWTYWVFRKRLRREDIPAS